jgi:predicted SAM-dependent methyltransferase
MEILKPAGRLIIAVPNYTSSDAQAYKQFWAAYDVPRHLYHFSPKSMETLLDRKGFALEKVKPMWFDSFYISMLSEKYKKGKNNYISAFSNGLISNIKALFNTRKCSSVIYIIRKK